jgi:hypothetical protein
LTGFKFTSWRETWDGSLDPFGVALMKHLLDDRDAEVHRWKSSRESRRTDKHLYAGETHED